ncbi:unnamed protein product, partial [Urochloa humidicola]
RAALVHCATSTAAAPPRPPLPLHRRRRCGGHLTGCLASLRSCGGQGSARARRAREERERVGKKLAKAAWEEREWEMPQVAKQ